MPEHHVIRVSSAILSADLTFAEQLVYIAIKSHQGEDKPSDRSAWCKASRRELAEDVRMNKPEVDRAVNRLIEAGWVEQNEDECWLKCLEETPS